ncbi:HpcH/HpaI aldolase/citrate lyase family protein [Halovivax gelatinilyticus]|uniref:HpcH/HpaI aldolase/citrate lyase family protein n=1 Tax=Halovivax gelatinilyticus TaxID=2961597 RepID=UPI0020CA7FE1|nr:CoA ester lyase [Halovivax gelatinilyticus]
MVRRSVMFTPGDRPEMMRKAPTAGADVLVFDLEDAVSPQHKEEARAAVRAVLSDPEFDHTGEVCVRINADGPTARADLDTLFDEVESLELDSIMLPKVQSAEDVRDVAVKLETRGVGLPVLALIENAAGVLAADEIAAVPATDAVIFGAEDFAADVGASRTREGTEVLYARQRVVVAAGAHDCDAIDTVFTDFGDEEGLSAETSFAIQLGYDGKLAIHPAQVDPINEAFTPEPDELEWARRVLEAKREAESEERGVFEVDGEMIDAPLIAQAERITERAQAADADGV